MSFLVPAVYPPLPGARTHGEEVTLLRDYEILFIVRPELDEEQVGEAVKSVDTLITNLGGASERTNVWGKRRLAYEVDRLREGHYVLTDFRLDPERLTEMEATLKISETVFRHLIVRKPDKPVARAVPAAVPPAPVALAAESDVEAPAVATAGATAGDEPAEEQQ